MWSGHDSAEPLEHAGTHPCFVAAHFVSSQAAGYHTKHKNHHAIARYCWPLCLSKLSCTSDCTAICVCTCLLVKTLPGAPSNSGLVRSVLKQ